MKKAIGGETIAVAIAMVLGACGTNHQEPATTLPSSTARVESDTTSFSPTPTVECRQGESIQQVAVLTAASPRPVRKGDIILFDNGKMDTWPGDCGSSGSKKPLAQALQHSPNLETLDGCVSIDDHSHLKHPPHRVREATCLLIKSDRYEQSFDDPTPFDMSLLNGLTGLRVLTVYARADIRGFEGLPFLASLSLEWAEGDPSFRGLSSFKSLVRLRLRGDVADLTGLSKLRKVALVDASVTKTIKLPKVSVPSLRRLFAFETPLSDTAVREFRDANPHTLFLADYGEQVGSYAAKGDRLVVRLHAFGKSGAYTVDGEAAKDLFSGFEFKPVYIGRADAASDVTFELYRGEKMMSNVQYMSSCSSGLVRNAWWPSDVYLTPASKVRIENWFKRQSIPYSLAEECGNQ